METFFEPDSEHLDQTFKRVQVRGKTLERVAFENCTFTGCTFNEVVFRACKFRDCTFQECNLWLVRVPASAFHQTQFQKCKVTGVNWVEASWSKKGLFKALSFEECDLTNSTFIGLELRKLQLTHCIARNVDFAESDLTQANFNGTDFTESRFMHTNLTEADFTDAVNYAVDVSQNTVKKAKFTLPEAINLLRCMEITLVE